MPNETIKKYFFISLLHFKIKPNHFYINTTIPMVFCHLHGNIKTIIITLKQQRK